MKYGSLKKTIDDMAHLYHKGLSPAGRAERHGRAKHPIKSTLVVYGVPGRNGWGQ